jgi:tRNA pseudouridine32 synthase/23S rRNA pseudouridine746 synthase
MTDVPIKLEKHLTVQAKTGISAVDFLAEHTPLSKQKLKVVMQKGAIWLEQGKKVQRIRRAKRVLNAGDIIHVYYDEHVLSAVPAEPELIADCGQYSVWNKPYGLLSQGSKWGDHCTVTRWAEQHLLPQRSSFVIHRLDRAANGLIVIAHEKKAAAALSALFQSRSVEKRYRIWVHGQFENVTQPVTVSQDIDGRHAVSHFSCIEFDEETNQSLLDVNIETGRKHQIRIHSAALGFPVVGDRLHGRPTDKQNLQLNAYFMRFSCPFRERVQEFNLLDIDRNNAIRYD